MCLIVFAYKTHPDYELILAANRDEFYGRPTRPATFWKDEDAPEILAGKDMKAGGTWMGLHKDGRWASVTNYRDPSIIKTNPPSRGELVVDYLNSQNRAMDYLQRLTAKAADYNGFNLLLWDDKGFYNYSNQSKLAETVTPGIHGLSNAFLNTNWPKLRNAKSQLQAIIDEEEFKKERLFELLADENKAAENELPVTGISQELEKAISSIFIRTETYGTRSSTILLIDKEGNIEFTERNFKPGTSDVIDENSYIFPAK